MAAEDPITRSVTSNRPRSLSQTSGGPGAPTGSSAHLADTSSRCGLRLPSHLRPWAPFQTSQAAGRTQCLVVIVLGWLAAGGDSQLPDDTPLGSLTPGPLAVTATFFKASRRRSLVWSCGGLCNATQDTVGGWGGAALPLESQLHPHCGVGRQGQNPGAVSEFCLPEGLRKSEN